MGIRRERGSAAAVRRRRNGAAGRRLASLCEVTRRLAAFEGVEPTVPHVLLAVHDAVPLASAILIEGRSGVPTKFVWHAPDATPGALLRAEANALSSWSCLAAPVPRAMPFDVRRAPLPFLFGGATGRVLERYGRRNFVALPLALEGGAIFGALQVESARSFDEDDLQFLTAVTIRLALAIDRRHATCSARDRTRSS